MAWTDKLSIRGKIAAGFGLICLGTLAVGGFAAVRLDAVRAVLGELRGSAIVANEALSAMAWSAEKIRFYQAAVLLSEGALRTERLGFLPGLDSELDRAWARLMPAIAAGDEQRVIGQLKETLDRFRATTREWRGLLDRGAMDGAIDLFNNRQKDDMRLLRGALEKAIGFEAQKSDRISAELAARSDSARLWILLSVGVLGLLGALAGVLLMLDLSRPLGALRTSMAALARDEVDVEIAALARRDEIGEMARGVAVFRETVRARLALQVQQTADAERRARQAHAMEQLASDFNRSVSGVLAAVAEDASGVETTAGRLADLAQQASSQAMSVSATVGQATTNVEGLAEAARQLAAGGQAAVERIEHASATARRAVEGATRARGAMTGLSDAADRIESVVQLIANIAGQTNLLALNATIEAARAGEAGRGFAVVAGEVKSLAAATTKATSEIAGQIAALQETAREAARITGEIAGVIGDVAEAAGSVGDVIATQESATQAIARNVAEASHGMRDAHGVMALLGEGASASDNGARAAMQAARKVTGEADGLCREIEAFLVAIQHAGDRRAYQRVPCALEVRLDTPAGSAATRLRDISLGGCLCDAVASCRSGDPATLIVAGGRIACRVVATEADGTRLQFALDDATRHVVQGLLPAEAA